MHSVYENMSSAELAVCEYISEMGLWWQYEQPVFVYDDKQRPRVWTPDFYIPELGIYIEVVGNRYNPNYSFRDKVYRGNRIPIIFLHIQAEDWKEVLIKGMQAIHAHRSEKIGLSANKAISPNGKG
jgi:hypothetical protein